VPAGRATTPNAHGKAAAGYTKASYLKDHTSKKIILVKSMIF